MTVTFTWDFPHWDVTKKINGFQNVIKMVQWRLTASDGTNNAIVFGKVDFSPPAVGATNFIKKDAITQDQLIEWVKPLMGYDGYVTKLTQRLADMVGPPDYSEAPIFAPISPTPVVAPASVAPAPVTPVAVAPAPTTAPETPVVAPTASATPAK